MSSALNPIRSPEFQTDTLLLSASSSSDEWRRRRRKRRRWRGRSRRRESGRRLSARIKCTAHRVACIIRNDVSLSSLKRFLRQLRDTFIELSASWRRRFTRHPLLVSAVARFGVLDEAAHTLQHLSHCRSRPLRGRRGSGQRSDPSCRLRRRLRQRSRSCARTTAGNGGNSTSCGSSCLTSSSASSTRVSRRFRLCTRDGRSSECS